MQTWHLGVFYFFFFTTIGVFVPFWGLFLHYRGFSPTEIGQLIAILTLSKVVAPNVWAAIADDIAARRGSSLGIVKYASLAAFLIYCFVGVVDGFWSMAIVMLGFCMFWNANLPQVEAATLKHLSDNSDQYGSVRLWGSVSFILVVLAMGWLLEVFGPSIIFPAGGVALASVFMVSFLMHDSHYLLPDSVPHARQVKALPLVKLIDRKVIFLLLLGVFMQLSHAPWQTFFSIYLESYGYTKLSIGMLWSVGVVFEIIIFIFGYKLLRRFALANLLSFTLLIAAIRWCMIAVFPESMTFVFITQVMHAITYGLYHLVMVQLINRLFQDRYQIRGQALYSSITYGLGGAIGSVSSGYLWSLYGKNTMFMGTGLMMLVVFIISVIFIKQWSVREHGKI